MGSELAVARLGRGQELPGKVLVPGGVPMNAIFIPSEIPTDTTTHVQGFGSGLSLSVSDRGLGAQEKD